MAESRTTNNSYTFPHTRTEETNKPMVRIEEPALRRPVSLYDNLQRRESGSLVSNSASIGNLASADPGPSATMDRVPSQANCISTTVPQNIAASNIGGKHVPTRNSLRHSRMIVLNRNGKVPRKYHPPFLHHHRLARALAALQVVLGIAVSSLAVWLLVWAPNLHVRDIPYWSGLPLLASGILGLMLLCCCRKNNPGIPHDIWMFSLKAVSLFLSVLAAVTCFCACVFALLHLIFLSSMTCDPAHVLHSTCVCQDRQRVYRYSDLNCPEVENILTILLIGSCAANGIGGIFTVWYVFLHWSNRFTHTYSQVKTNDNKQSVIYNKKETVSSVNLP